MFLVTFKGPPFILRGNYKLDKTKALVKKGFTHIGLNSTQRIINLNDTKQVSAESFYSTAITQTRFA